MTERPAVGGSGVTAGSGPGVAVDALGEALHHLRMSSAFYCRSELSAPWGLDLPPLEGCLMFHVVTSGRCWLEVPGADPCCLQPGDLGLVPHGGGHLLLSEPEAPTTPLFDLPREELSETYELLRHGGGGAETTLVCGAVRFEHPAARQLVRALPSVIHVDTWGAAEVEWLQSSLRFMAAEAKHLRPGGETIVTRLCDVLVIQAIRAWLARDPAASTGWLGALKDPQLGRAISAVHRDPSAPWTVEALAQAAGMSRSAFAARFHTTVGETPIQYVTRWRMHVAHSLLADGSLTLAQIAERLGYGSEAAFSRAFKRSCGSPPGAVRRARSG